MTIQEKVAREIYETWWLLEGFDGDPYFGSSIDLWKKWLPAADRVITTFLKTVAETGWRMRPDEATEEMEAAMKRLVYDLFLDWNENQEQLRSVYPKIFHSLWATMPEFEWDK